MKRLFILVIISLIIPVASCVDYSSDEYNTPMWGLNWSVNDFSGNWVEISNNSMKSKVTDESAQAEIYADSENNDNSSFSNITYLSVALKSKISDTSMFTIPMEVYTAFNIWGYYGEDPIVLILNQSMRKSLIGTKKYNYSVGIENGSDYLQLWDSYNDEEENHEGDPEMDGWVGEGFTYAQLAYIWEGGDNYKIEVWIETVAWKIDQDDLLFPDDYYEVKAEEKVLLGALKTYRYRIYSGSYTYEGSSNNTLRSPRKFTWWTYKSADDNYFKKFRVHSWISSPSITSMVNNDDPPSNIEPQISGSLNSIESSFKALADGFDALHIPVVGNVLYTVGVPITNVMTTMTNRVEDFIGIYQVFFLSLLIYGLFSGKMYLVWNHLTWWINTILKFAFMIKDVIMSLISIVSNIPIVGWIGIAGVLAVILTYSIM